MIDTVSTAKNPREQGIAENFVRTPQQHLMKIESTQKNRQQLESRKEQSFYLVFASASFSVFFSSSFGAILKVSENFTAVIFGKNFWTSTIMPLFAT